MLRSFARLSTNASKRFRPLGDRVLVQKLQAETQTKSGIFLPETAKERQNTATVMATGPGKYRDGKLTAIDLKEGDLVVVPEYGGMTIKLEGEEFQVYREDDIVGVMKGE
eukprot:GDKH01010732.1.p1 GENE.GDKH01010732.1~~GDKH01010732.1.p1  ORF type:complete len:110 (-),score=44.81 GDKH01010732.1:210-539(-)